MNKRDKEEELYEYLYLDIPVISSQVIQKKKEVEENVVVIDLGRSDDAGVIDFNILGK